MPRALFYNRRVTGSIRTLLLVLLVVVGCGRGDASGGAASAKASPQEQKLRTTDWTKKETVVSELPFLETCAAQSRGSESLRDAFVGAVSLGIVGPTVRQLSSELREASGDDYDAEYAELKLYIALHDTVRAKEQSTWMKETMVPRAAAKLELKPDDTRLFVVLGRYVDLVAEGHAKLEGDEAVIEGARAVLRRHASGDNLYRRIVERLDPAYSPVSLESIFSHQPDALRAIKSKQHVREQKYYEVPAAYTKTGLLAVTDRIAREGKRIEKETWVLVADGKKPETKAQVEAVAAVRKEYEKRYAEAWLAFVNDVELARSSTAKQLHDRIVILLKPERPLRHLFETVASHTQLVQIPSVKKKFERFVVLAGTKRQRERTYLTQYHEVLSGLKSQLDRVLKQDPAAALDRPSMNQAEESASRFLPDEASGFRDVARAWLLTPLTMQ